MSMSDQKLLEEGLAILSQCKKETGDIWHAHFGAAAIAGYFFVKDNKLPGELSTIIEMQAKAMLENQRLNEFKPSRSNCGFEQAETIIVGALDKTIDGLHWVGHNVIYSAVSMLAIRELKGWGSEQELMGLSELISSFQKTIPGRSWIGYTTSEVKKITLTEEDRFPRIGSPNELSHFVLEQLTNFPVIYRAESHHDLIGHMLTFSHALNLLYDMGCRSFFHRGLVPLFKLIKVLQSSCRMKPGDKVELHSPVDRLPLQQAVRSSFLPTELGYWAEDNDAKQWDFGHVFKFPFSFYDHLRRAGSVKASSVENFRYIIGQ